MDGKLSNEQSNSFAQLKHRFDRHWKEAEASYLLISMHLLSFLYDVIPILTRNKDSFIVYLF